jgi:DNA-binding beta-propeller fold protein YncE
MRRLLVFVFLVALAAFSQSDLPQLGYKVDPDWPQLPAGTNLVETPAVAVDAAENVYVFHRGDPPILVFDKNGKHTRSLGHGLFDSPHGLRVAPDGSLWAIDNVSNIVVKMDPSSGRVKMVLGRRRTTGEAENLFNKPTDVAFGPTGDIYVSDGYGNSRVVQYSKDGEFIRAWGKRGVNPGEFNTPHAVVLDKQNKLYVADRENFRIQIFDQEGNFQQMWTHVGSPWGLFLTRDDMLFMSDGYNNRILKLDLDGKIIGSLGEYGKLAGQFDLPHHFAVGPSGNLYVGEIVNLRAQRFLPR